MNYKTIFLLFTLADWLVLLLYICTSCFHIGYYSLSLPFYHHHHPHMLAIHAKNKFHCLMRKICLYFRLTFFHYCISSHVHINTFCRLSRCMIFTAKKGTERMFLCVSEFTLNNSSFHVIFKAKIKRVSRFCRHCVFEQEIFQLYDDDDDGLDIRG